MKRFVPIVAMVATVLLAPTRGRSGDIDVGIPLEAVMRDNGCSVEQQPANESWPPTWDTASMAVGDVPPARVVRDPYPTFHGVAVDPDQDMVAMTDSNRHGFWTYARTAGSLTAQEATEPLTGVRGPATGMMFVATVALDPKRREIYTVDNDIGDRLLTFPYDAIGNVKPIRVLEVPHQAWGIALSHKREEVAISVESPRMVVVYRRGASEKDLPLRVLRGPNTGLGDPHGVAFDDANDELVVANHGNQSSNVFRREINTDPSDKARTGRRLDDPWEGGRWEAPSLTIFRSDAGGDVAPTRRIQGPKTGLDWPMGISLDTANNEIAVVNNGDSSLRIFRRTDTGDVAPLRVVKGPRTGIVGPMGVAVDTKNNEIWVTNYGEHTAVVFDRLANGNVAPKRIIRNGPAGAPTSGFGNPGAVAFDSKRDEILVPN